MSWLALSFVTMLFWGVWGVLHKIATTRIGPNLAWLFQGLGTLAVLITFGIYTYLKEGIHLTDLRASLLALSAGALGAMGTIAFLFAVSKGRASVVVTLTALYPIVTILLAVLLLKEPLNPKQLIGMILALIAMALLAG